MRRLLLAVALCAATLPTAQAEGRAQGPGPQAAVAGPEISFQHRPKFELTSTTPGATFECRIDDGSYRECSSPYKPRRLRIGAHALSLRAVDAGVAGPPAPDHEFRIVDTEIVGHPAKATFERSLHFRLRLRAAGAGADPDFECSLDGRGYQPCQESHGTGRLGFGAHTLRVRASKDDSGRDPSPASHHFKVERRWVSFGRSVGGRKLRAFRAGDPEARRTALVVGSIHGDETEGHEITTRLRSEYRDISKVELWIVETVNPDGVARHTRKNAHGVDLNRNFGEDWSGAAPPSSADYGGPRPFSEPESRAVRDLAKRLRPSITVWYHQPWGAVLVPCHGSAPVERDYARAAGMRTSCRGAGLPGTARNWQNSNVSGHAFVVELGGGELGSSAGKRHARAVARVVKPG